MKKILLILTALFLMSYGFGQNYKAQMDKINKFLKTFDGGYYGYISIEDDNLYTNIKSGGHSIVNIYDISEIKVTEANRKVEIFCEEGDCVTGVNGGMYSSMTYRTTTDFDAESLADDLNALINAYKNKEEAPQVQANGGAPQIIMYTPEVSDGSSIVEQSENINLEGKIISDNQITEVLINGRDVFLDDNGYFSISVSLSEGENSFTVRATDSNQETSILKFIIERN